MAEAEGGDGGLGGGLYWEEATGRCMVDSERGDRDISIFQPAEQMRPAEMKDIKDHFHYEVKWGQRPKTLGSECGVPCRVLRFHIP